MLTLELEDTGLPITCLDISFYHHNKRQCLATTTHSKDIDPKFAGLPFTRYPHPSSFISPAILYNTFLTEIHRYHRNNTFFNTFKHDTIKIMTYMITKGYNRKRLAT